MLVAHSVHDWLSAPGGTASAACAEPSFAGSTSSSGRSCCFTLAAAPLLLLPLPPPRLLPLLLDAGGLREPWFALQWSRHADLKQLRRAMEQGQEGTE